jgi:hypothetical protein
MIKYLVIHCSDSPNDRHVEAADIHEWHMDWGWAGIGYNYVIQRNGTLETCRPHFWEPAHVAGHNHHSLGICLVGRDEFTNEQIISLKNILYFLKFRYQGSEIVGHYELDDSKTCPNFDVPAWVKQHMPKVQ